MALSPRIDSTPARISTNMTIARQTPKMSFGDRMKAGLAGHTKNILLTKGITAGGAAQLVNGTSLSNAVDRRNSAGLALQEATQMENRRFQALSSASKARHDVDRNTIHNSK